MISGLLVLGAILGTGLVCYACCVTSGRADDMSDKHIDTEDKD